MTVVDQFGKTTGTPPDPLAALGPLRQQRARDLLRYVRAAGGKVILDGDRLAGVAGLLGLTPADVLAAADDLSTAGVATVRLIGAHTIVVHAVGCGRAAR